MVKIYTDNGSMLSYFESKADSYLRLTKKIIDLGSDKPDNIKFAHFLARKYSDSKVIHFKDTKALGRVNKENKRKNLDYVFKARKLKNSFFDIATAFFTLHEFENEEPDYDRENELKILYRVLKPKGRLIIVDYDLKWVQGQRMNEEQFIQEVFTDKNERKVMKEEDKCMKMHISWGLEDCIKNCATIGFNKIFSDSCNIQTSWGVKPKISLYVGEKI